MGKWLLICTIQLVEWQLVLQRVCQAQCQARSQALRVCRGCSSLRVCRVQCRVNNLAQCRVNKRAQGCLHLICLTLKWALRVQPANHNNQAHNLPSPVRNNLSSKVKVPNQARNQEPSQVHNQAASLLSQVNLVRSKANKSLRRLLAVQGAAFRQSQSIQHLLVRVAQKRQ